MGPTRVTAAVPTPSHPLQILHLGDQKPAARLPVDRHETLPITSQKASDELVRITHHSPCDCRQIIFQQATGAPGQISFPGREEQAGIAYKLLLING
jgi:hypothetical protein